MSTSANQDFDARKKELWDELGELYRQAGDAQHFEHLRNIDGVFYGERRRLAGIEAFQARQAAERRRRESSYA